MSASATWRESRSISRVISDSRDRSCDCGVSHSQQRRTLGDGLVSRVHLLIQQRRCGFRQILDSCQQVRRMHRLPEKLKIMAVFPRGFQQMGGDRLPGKQQHFAFRATLSHLYRQIDPRELWHHNIGNEEIWSLKSSGFQSLVRLVKGSGTKPTLKAQNHRQACRNNIFIIDDKDGGLPWLVYDRSSFPRPRHNESFGGSSDSFHESFPRGPAGLVRGEED
jgi:hypothetical protein